jgi:hypothetical protein
MRTSSQSNRQLEHATMTERKAMPIDVIDFRAESYSPDGKNIIVSLATKYSAERRAYSLPLASLSSFISDLQNLQSGKRPVETSAVSAAAAQPVPAKDLNQINITVPKNWAMRSGLPDHPFVIMVFNPQTEAQTGFALSAASAKEFAAGLTKYADELAHHETTKPKSN